MSSPSSVQPCPEPSAYSNDSFSAAEVESYSAADVPPSTSVETSILNSKVVSSRFAEIDSILSKQLGAVTVPGANATPSLSQPPSQSGFPVLPTVNESSAIPVLSSNMGSDINNSFTLLQNPSILPTNQLGSDTAPTVSMPVTASTALPNLVSFTPTSTITSSPVTVAPSGPVTPIQSNEVSLTPSDTFAPVQSNEVSLTPSESFDNINQTNIAKFIQKNKPGNKEHFNGSSRGKKEHFGITTGSSMTDTLLLCAIIGGVIYFIISPSHNNGAGIVHGVEDTISKVPVISQLVDPGVSDTNKLLIVAAVVLAFIFISNLLS
jgi:hypothetical protein